MLKKKMLLFFLRSTDQICQDITFDGGVIHIIDSVLTLPLNDPGTSKATNLTALFNAVAKVSVGSSPREVRDTTIFAPNNAAFEAIGTAISNMSTNDLAKLLSNHVVQGPPVYYSSVLKDMTLKTNGGVDVTITTSNGNIWVNNAKVVTPDILTADGVFHVIDRYIPPSRTLMCNI
jgi:uncharacterized surface protein with fasciclin (FAS1) repeats